MISRFILAAVTLALTACASSSDGGNTAPSNPSATPGPVARIVLSPSTALMPVGGIQTYAATVTDSAGRTITGKTLTWVSTAPDVATVTPSGVVSAVGTALTQTGTSIIIASVDGVNGSATVTSSLPTNPFVAGFSIVPSRVVVGASSATATATARVMDVGPGVQSVRMAIGPPNGLNSTNIVCDMTMISGTRADGTWTCPLVFERGATSGRWAFQFLQSDEPPGPGHNGNLWQISAAKAMGATSSVAVLQSAADTTPPVLTGLTIAPASVAQTSATSVVVTARVADAAVGVDQIIVDIGDSNGSTESGPASYCYPRPTADITVWTCTMPVSPRQMKTGIHPVRSVEVVDKSGNARVYTSAQIFQAGFQGMFIVTP